MKLLRWTAMVAAAGLVMACNEPTGPNLDESLDAVDPVVATFAASRGLPNGPGAPRFPDGLTLSDAQKTQIDALVAAFAAANATDLAAMKAAHEAARAARQAGKSREEIKAILDGAKAAADRVHAAGGALRTAIGNILTAEQRAWLEAHRPDRPPRTP